MIDFALSAYILLWRFIWKLHLNNIFLEKRSRKIELLIKLEYLLFDKFHSNMKNFSASVPDFFKIHLMLSLILWLLSRSKNDQDPPASETVQWLKIFKIFQAWVKSRDLDRWPVTSWIHHSTVVQKKIFLSKLKSSVDSHTKYLK